MRQKIAVLVQNGFLGSHLRHRNGGDLTLHFARRSDLQGANLSLTKAEQLEFYCIFEVLHISSSEFI